MQNLSFFTDDLDFFIFYYFFFNLFIFYIILVTKIEQILDTFMSLAKIVLMDSLKNIKSWYIALKIVSSNKATQWITEIVKNIICQLESGKVMAL